MDKLTEEMEEKVYDAQHDEIVRVYGKRAARNANYGWGTTDEEISTKVYLRFNPAMVLTSWMQDGQIAHAWREY